MAEPVRVRRLTDQEGQRLQKVVRRGTGSAVRLRRAMVILASAGGNTVPAIARLVQGDEDAIRQVIHRFNEMGMASLDPQWAGGRPLISPDDEAFIVAAASTRPEKLDQPFTRWSIRKLADYLARTTAAVARSESAGNAFARSWASTASPFNGPRPGRSPPTPTGMPSWPVSSMSPAASQIGCLLSTSSARSRSVRTPAPVGRPRTIRTGCPPTITSCTVSGSSTPATPWARTRCGV